MRFDWDAAKDERNRQERGLGVDFGALIFDGNTIEWPDSRLNYGETRVRAIGEAEGIVLHVVFTDRGDIRRIISVRSQTAGNEGNGTRADDVGGDQGAPPGD